MNLSSVFLYLGLTDPALQAAFLQGVFVALGLILAAVILGLILLSRGDGRRAETDLREQQAEHLQHAILAETRAHWHELDRQGPLASVASNLIDKMEQGRWAQPGFTPFIPKEAPSLIFSAIERDFALLERSLIDLVVRYYRQLEVVAQFALDLRSDRFHQLSTDRKIEVVRDYFALLQSLKNGAAELNGKLEQTLKLKRRERDTNIRVEAAYSGSPALPSGSAVVVPAAASVR
jgi:hypothetical protein